MRASRPVEVHVFGEEQRRAERHRLSDDRDRDGERAARRAAGRASRPDAVEHERERREPAIHIAFHAPAGMTGDTSDGGVWRAATAASPTATATPMPQPDDRGARERTPVPVEPPVAPRRDVVTGS